VEQKCNEETNLGRSAGGEGGEEKILRVEEDGSPAYMHMKTA
jgi:predicted metalloprotease with PDZ domain